MPNPTDLLLYPTHTNGPRSSLSPEWAAVFFDTHMLQLEHLVEQRGDSVVWLEWIEHNSCPQQAADFVVTKLACLEFNWMALLHPDEPQSGLCLTHIFPYCAADTLARIFTQLSEQDLHALKHQPFQNDVPSVSILGAIAHDNSAVVGELVKWGWDLEETNALGETLLLQARRWEDAQILLNNGANVRAVDNKRTTVLDRVQRWAARSRLSGGDITKIVNTHLCKTTSAGVKQNETKTSALTTLFAQISQGKTGDLQKTLASLHKTGARADEMMDVAGRSLVQVARDYVFKQGIYGYNQAPARFFIRFLTLMLNHHHAGGLVDLDRPFCGHPEWTERDVLMMSALILSANPHLKSEFIPFHLNPTFDDWKNQRYPHVVGHLLDFLEPLMVDDSTSDWFRKLLTSELDPHAKNNVGFFSEVAQDIARLPFDHRLVRFMVQGLNDDLIQVLKGDFDAVYLQASLVRWGHWYCQMHHLDEAHPLRTFLDGQLIVAWHEHYLRSDARDIGSLVARTLKTGDENLLCDFIRQRSEQLQHINPHLLHVWRARVLNEHNITSLLDLSSERSHMHASTVKLLEKVEAQVVHNLVSSVLTEAQTVSVKRKM